MSPIIPILIPFLILAFVIGRATSGNGNRSSRPTNLYSRYKRWKNPFKSEKIVVKVMPKPGFEKTIKPHTIVITPKKKL